MKKMCVLAICLLFASAGAFAMDKAAGGGILYNNSTTLGEVEGYDWEMNRNGFGAFGFFGMSQFLEFNFGFLYKDPSSIKLDGETYSVAFDPAAALQLGIYGKYPIPLSDTLVFFPTGGIDLELSLSDEDYSGWKWWHDLWLRAGVGLDVFFSEKLFLRSHLIYGAAIPVGGEEEMGLKFGHGFLFKVGLGWMLQ